MRQMQIDLLRIFWLFFFGTGSEAIKMTSVESNFNNKRNIKFKVCVVAKRMVGTIESLESK